MNRTEVKGMMDKYFPPLDECQWIALCGYAQSGKDTVAQHLVENYGYTRVAFADPLKELALEINPMVRTSCSVPLALVVYHRGWEEAKKIPDVREFLQNLGVGVRNVLGINAWVDLGIGKAVQHDKVVFTDARFKNELSRIELNGGKFVRVERPGVGPVNDHVSEAEWVGWLGSRNGPDFTIYNEGTINHLKWRVDAAMFNLGLVDGL